MKMIIRFAAYICMPILLSSCATNYINTFDSALSKIVDAGSYLHELEGLKSEYPEEIKKIKEYLDQAKFYINKEDNDQYNPDMAYENAQKAIFIANKIIGRDILKKENEVKKAIKNIEKKPEESSYRELLSDMKSFMKHVKKIKSGQEISLNEFPKNT